MGRGVRGGRGVWGGACGLDPEWEEPVTGPLPPSPRRLLARSRSLLQRCPCSAHVEEGVESGSPNMPGVGRRKEKGNRRWRMWKRRKHHLGREPERKPRASTEKVSIGSPRRGRAGQCTVHVCMRRTAANGDTGWGGRCFWLRSSPAPCPEPFRRPNPFPLRARLFVNLPAKTPKTNSFLENTECVGEEQWA